MTNEQAAAAIREQRQALKLSMRAAAKLGGVSATAWSDLEASKSPPSLATQRAVSVALGWPIDWLDQVERNGSVTRPGDDQPAALQELVSLAVMRATRSLAEQVAEMGAAIEQLRARLDQQQPSSGEAQS